MLLRLAEGDTPGTLGHARAVAEEVVTHPDLVEVLVDALAHDEEGLRNRAAIALDRAARHDPRPLAPFAGALLDAAEADRPGGALRRLLPLLLSRVPFDVESAHRLVDHAAHWLRTEPSAVRANALDALVAVVHQHPSLLERVRPSVEAALDHPAPSVRARARRQCARLDRLTEAD
ncbi:hypothetical protein [Rubrivirga marina]|uniref:hypothetical protein n=1 Tax=Rubrivirga marina TaxID=1196024 RepID=UPI00117AC439|nr:hypothetical protein [Rubrivirga marina]